MVKPLLQVLLILLCSFITSKCSYLVCVKGKEGDQAWMSGPPGGGHQCDETVKQLSGNVNISNNTIVLFQTNVSVLDFNFSIRNLQNISFTSSFPGGTKIICTDAGRNVNEQNHIDKGLTFTKINGLRLEMISFVGCSVFHNFTQRGLDEIIQYRSAILMQASTDVLIANVNVHQSKGKGFSLIDCRGNITITGCVFAENKEAQNLMVSGGGGLFIVQGTAGELPPNNVTYLIENCTFTDNVVNNHVLHYGVPVLDISRGGGGVAVMIKGNSTGNRVTIVNTNVSGNVAINGYGGGLALMVSESACNNTFEIQHTTIHSNSALDFGGGGMDVGFLAAALSRYNQFIFTHLYIHGNSGTFGGGGALFATYASSKEEFPVENSFQFFNCEWYNNRASYGAGLMVTTGGFGMTISYHRPQLYFTNCRFVKNIVNGSIQTGFTPSDDDKPQQHTEGTGILYIRSYTVHINGTATLFSSNTGSAIYCFESVIRITDNSHVEFTDNAECLFGGAMRLIGSSFIQIGHNTFLEFHNNSATEKGGAIYVHNPDSAASKMVGLCFLQYINKPPHIKNNSTLLFTGNQLTGSRNNTGTALYVSSLKPCVRVCPNASNVSVSESLQCIADMTFDQNITQAVGTEGSYFIKSNLSEPILLVPGKVWQLPLKLKNEIDQIIRTPLLYAAVAMGNISIKDQSFIADNRLTVYGIPGSIGTIKISTIQYQNVSVRFSIKLSGCPPGFAYDSNQWKCSCAVGKKAYNGIFNCDQVAFTAHQYIGYWSGYINDLENSIQEKGREDILYTATCPLGFCFDSPYGEITLPDVPDGNKLSLTVCNANRHGILCGECKSGHSVFFHSSTYTCGPNTYCRYGLLFYTLSEILPLTVLFCITVLFHIDFNSGYLNGFLLFAQILDTLSLQANGGVLLDSKPLKYMTNFIKLIYSPFNLEFFQIDSMEYCLFEGANFLQIVSIRYISVVYSLLLILLLIFLMRYNCCYKVKIVCLRLHITNSSSMVDSLAAFLVLCYSLCCRNCYQLLNISWFQGSGLTVYRRHPRVFRMGSVTYSDPQFIWYATLASVFLVFFIIIPPTLLIFQPLAHKFLPNGFFENRRVQKLCLHVERFKPLFDKLQGCFKDKHRYFAGLYLIYRFIPNAIFAIVNVRLHVFILVQVTLSLMLIVHCLVKPYKNNVHNNIDTAIFGNMLIINTITIYRYFMTKTSYFTMPFSISGYVQLILVYLPAVTFILSLIGLLIWKKAPPSFRMWVLNKKQGGRNRNSTYMFLKGIDAGLRNKELPRRPAQYDSMEIPRIHKD